ncbi:hypothetical protein CRE_07169, partial [Caenorhabditis remanei]
MKLIRKYHIVPYENGSAVESAKRFLENVLNDNTLDPSEKCRFYQDLLYRIRNHRDMPIVNEEMVSIVQDNLIHHGGPPIPPPQNKLLHNTPPPQKKVLRNPTVLPTIREEEEDDTQKKEEEKRDYEFGNYEQHELTPKLKKSLMKERFVPFENPNTPQIPVHPLPPSPQFALRYNGGPMLNYRGHPELQFHPYLSRKPKPLPRLKRLKKKKITKKKAAPKRKYKVADDEEPDFDPLEKKFRHTIEKKKAVRKIKHGRKVRHKVR